MKLYLAITFAWNGILFFLILAPGITGDSYGNYLFACLFIVVSALFATDLFRNKMRFSLPDTKWRRYPTLILLVLVFCYPLFVIALGHRLTSLIMPGTMPCPTTELALLLLTIALLRVNEVTYILLPVWAIPFPPFIQIPKYCVYEEAVMFVTGMYALILLVRFWKVERA